jgi:hypothetical protein
MTYDNPLMTYDNPLTIESPASECPDAARAAGGVAGER